MLGSVLVRDKLPGSSTFPINSLGRRHLDSMRVKATRSGKVAAIFETRG